MGSSSLVWNYKSMKYKNQRLLSGEIITCVANSLKPYDFSYINKILTAFDTSVGNIKENWSTYTAPNFCGQEQQSIWAMFVWSCHVIIVFVSLLCLVISKYRQLQSNCPITQTSKLLELLKKGGGVHIGVYPYQLSKFVFSFINKIK